MKASDRLQFRLTAQQKNRIKLLAKIYAEGNVSMWLVYSALNAKPKFLVKSELSEHIKKAASKKKRP